MIGAMPAVAVRHERRKQEKRSKRPCQLYLGGLGVKRTSPPSRGSSPTPSPLQSPPTSHDDAAGGLPPDFYVCGKVSVLHIVVVSLLLGAILLIVGLVQLTPGADASDHRYYLMGAGSFLMLLGILLTLLRCCLFPWHVARLRRRCSRRMRRDDSTPASLPPSDKGAQAELRNGGPAGSTDEEALVSPNTSSSVATCRATSEPTGAASASHSSDALLCISAAASEHDALVASASAAPAAT